MAGMTALTYEILLSLADDDRHGYGIIKDVEARDLANYIHGGFFGALSLMKSFRSDYPLSNWFSLTLKVIHQ